MDGKIDFSDELIEILFQCMICVNCFKNCFLGVNVLEIIKQVCKDMVNIGFCYFVFIGMNDVFKKYINIYVEDVFVDFKRVKNKKVFYLYFMGCVGVYCEEDVIEVIFMLLDYLGVDYILIDEVCCSGVLEDVGFSIYIDYVKINSDCILVIDVKMVFIGCFYCYWIFINWL